MHQLRHGVISNIVIEFHKFLTFRNRGVELKTVVNKFVLDIISFQLGWCKLKTYPKKQWVSENTFGSSRLIQYFMAMFILNTNLSQRDINAKDAFSLFEKVINSLSVMISALMSKDNIKKNPWICTFTYFSLLHTISSKNILLITPKWVFGHKVTLFL